MARDAATLLLLVVVGVLALHHQASPAAAFNITRILGEFPDFTTFNSLLTQTKLADEINRRQTITVLALDNGAAGDVTSLPSDEQRKVLSVHVVLDYYDEDKLGAMKSRSAVLTTLFQSSGQATDRMGFINYTKRADGQMVFGSAEPGASLNSHMVKVVVRRPYNISVIQVSSAIVPPGVAGGGGAPPPGAAKEKTPVSAPTPSPSKGKKEAPVPGPSDDDAGADAPADAPADGPVADGPAADGPMADGPTADGPAEADAPAHEKSDAADAPEGSAAGRAMAGAGAGLGVIGFLVIIILSL
uniref:FAS1 domain-containing protein n=1 Tax=Leersia perrieri TaxID=77586 RepID=A0A0D9VFQ8_9ORYZ